MGSSLQQVYKENKIFKFSFRISGPLKFSNSKTAICRFFIHEEFDINENRCQETCDKFGDPTCFGYAPEGDCYCKKGYTRLTANGICVPTNSYSCRRRMPPTEGILKRIVVVEKVFRNSLPCSLNRNMLKETERTSKRMGLR